MARSTISGRFYQQLLGDSQLDPLIQQRIADYGLARNDSELLAGLAAHPNLDDAIDARLEKVRAVAVRAAWLNRPGRSPKAVAQALKGETRITLLTHMASKQGLTQQTYLQLAMTDNFKISVLLACNPSVCAPIQHRVLITAGRLIGAYSSRALLDSLRELIGQNPAVVRSLTTRMASLNGWYLVCSTAGLTAEEQGKVISVLQRHRFSQYDYTGHLFFYTALELASNPSTSSATLASLAEICVTAADSDNFPMSWKRTLDRVSTDVANALTHNLLNPELATLDFTQIDSNLTATTLAAYCKASFQRPNQGILLQLATQVALDDTALQMIGPKLSPDARLKAMRVHREDVTKCVTLLTTNSARHDLDDLLHVCEDPSGILAAYVTALVADKTPIPTTVLTSSHLTSQVALSLPVSLFSARQLPEETAHAANLALLEAFGTNATLWEIAESLLASFDGSFAELVETCQLLSPRDS